MDNGKRSYYIGEGEAFNCALFIDAQSEQAVHHFSFYLERNAILAVELLIVRAHVDVTIDCFLRGQGAEATIIGAYNGGMSDKVNIVTQQHHQAPHTRSKLVMRGVLRDSAHAHYHGLIRIDKDAHGANASQENKNMLLSDQARAVSIPTLEVLTNDVQCFHGSATGRPDSEQLFYCASRGVDEKTAQRLLLQGFFAELFVGELSDKTFLLYE